MKLQNIFLLHDRRINSLSVSAVTTIGEYMEWFDAYGEDNKLAEQRPQLKTRSANMIRRRLVEDLKQGAIIPPIVIGLSTDADLNYVKEDNVQALINQSLGEGSVIGACSLVRQSVGKWGIYFGVPVVKRKDRSKSLQEFVKYLKDR